MPPTLQGRHWVVILGSCQVVLRRCGVHLLILRFLALVFSVEGVILCSVRLEE